MSDIETITKRVDFLQQKINWYCECIVATEKTESTRLWIEWINNWNNEVLELKEKLKK